MPGWGRHLACPASNRGSALLTVLWLSAALAAICLSLSTTVRGEVERTSTALDGVRSYYLAQGAIYRGLLELLWSVQYPEKRVLPRGATQVLYTFPSGMARLEIIPEASKLDVNTVNGEDLSRLLLALGVDGGQASAISEAIVDWRSGRGGEYLSVAPSFGQGRASFQEIEELLLVKGVTPDIFYGTYVPAPEGAAENEPRLRPRAGLMECLSVYGSRDRVDANTANPAVLAAVGLDPYAVSALVQRRSAGPLDQGKLNEFMGSIGAPVNRLRVEGNSIVTMRATAQIRLPNGQMSDLKRTVAAQIKYMPPGSESAVQILRWYDTAWSQ